MEGGEIQYRWIDNETAQLGEFAPLTSDANKELWQWTTIYIQWSNINVLYELTHLYEYEQAFAGKPDTARTISGKSYIRRGDGAYAQRDTVWPTDVLMAEEGAVAALICTSRDSTAVLVREGCEDLTVLRLWQKAFPMETIYPVRYEGTMRVETRDGVGLSTDVFLPVGAGERLPTILVRTPYGKIAERRLYYRYVQRGYAVVLQDVRGCEESEGEFDPKRYEIDDGDDTLNWIAAQPWSNGMVGMNGASYLSYTQWAAAASGNPHLNVMISMVTGGSAFKDTPRRGGFYMSSMMPVMFAMSSRTIRWDLCERSDWDELLDIRPLDEIPRRALGVDIPYFNRWVQHPHDDDFWKKSDWQTRWHGRQIPVMIVSGWFDSNINGTMQALDLTSGYPAGTRKAVLGSWEHNCNCRYDFDGVFMGRNALRYDLDLLYLMWLDRYLKDIDNGIDKTPAVEYFTLTEDKWKTACSWPPSNCHPISLYLDKDGLLVDEPQADGCSEYNYDPEDRIGRYEGLSFMTPPLEKDMTITGDIWAELYISSSASDTDFIVYFSEIGKTSNSVKLSEGVLSSKYRNGFGKPEYLEPGNVYLLKIRMTMTSNQLRKGTRIRLAVASSGKGFFTNDTAAHNKIHYGKDYPSRIVMTVE